MGENFGFVYRVFESDQYVWSIGLLTWVPMTQPTGGGGGGAATIADGADVAEGATTDVAVQGDNAGTISAKLRGLNKSIAAGLGVTGPLTDAQLRASAVPVSAAALPLPTGAATEATLLTRTKPADQQHAIVDTSALPTGASTEVTLALIKAKTDNLDVALSTRTKPADPQHVIVDSSAAIPVTGPLTDAQLRASAVPVSAASLPLPAGAATEATLAAVKTDVDRIPALGQALMAASVPVAIASDQGLTVSVSGATAGTFKTQIVGTSGGVSAAVKAASTIPVNTDTALVVSMRPIDFGQLGFFVAANLLVGQEPMATSVPVVIASDQSPIPITGSISATSAATATDAPPVYDDGVSEPLSQDTQGNLRVTWPDRNLDFFGDLNPFGDVNVFGIPGAGRFSKSFPLGRG